VHLAVMGGIALTMLNTDIPSMWKYFILTVFYTDLELDPFVQLTFR
jgi:hypothetical protein